MTEQQAASAWLAEMRARTAEDFSAELEGARLACRGWNLAAANRRGIVLVHGFRAHAHWWDHVGPALAETHRVAAFSLSGMGDSEHRETYSRAQHGREIWAVAEASGIDRPIVIAHSYGAVAALIACRAGPERARRIIVLDSALPTAEDDGHQIPTPPLRTYPDRETAISRFRLIPPGGWPHPDVLHHIAEHSVIRLADGRWGWKFDNAMPHSLNREDYRPLMLGVTTPCDIVHGDRSEIYTPERQAATPEIVANCGSLVSIPAAHHHLMIEQPLTLVAVLRALLANDKAA